ncbi:MAG: GspH/FimT family pseudopilin [bacterium]
MLPLKKNQLGFTLPELLIVVGMISILTAVAIPLMTANIPRFELKGAIRTLIADFQKAKIEAVKRNCNVEIRFYPEPVPVAAEKFTAGGNGSYQLVAMDDNSVLLSRNMPKYVTLYLPSFTLVPQTAPALDYYKAGYKPQGLPVDNGSVYLVNSKATSYRLSLSAAGHVSMSMSQVTLSSLSAW